jgi:tRNA threonylcarbamoyladenosine biosynthesis protein TsaB
MRILAIDSSAISASAAVVEDDKLLGEFYINTRQTHSQTLMPMVEQVLKCTCVPLNSIDLFAVSAGPGSFTGVRIGVACIKGMAMADKKPCAGVSTLEAIAQNLAHMDAIVCAVMDARCGQVYNAVFTANGGKLQRITEDRAISIEDLTKECKTIGEKYSKPLFLVGDGAKLCYNTTGFHELNASLPPEHLLNQRAFGVAQSALALSEQGKTVTPAALAPIYLRMPQAERELRKRQNKN